jgi:ABC-type transport system involved in multi-copper enzyme maturation permease subunit
MGVLAALGRLHLVGTRVFEVDVPGTPSADTDDEVIPPPHPMAVEFRGTEIRGLRISSSENISLSHEPDAMPGSFESLSVKADEDFNFRRQPNSRSPFQDGDVSELYIRNLGVDEAHVRLTAVTDVIYPEVRAVPIVALGLSGIVLLYFLQYTFLPRLSAIALATFKSEVAQPLFAIVVILGVSMLLLSIYIPYNTFGEDIKMLKDSGLTLIRVLCIVLAVWGASTTLADEIEGRTALTVLSKPVRRRSFVIGKFFGIAWTTALMFVLLGAVLLAVTSYKMIYDARETSNELPTWQACYLEMSSVVPGLLLAFMETLILAALSVAISTRLPMFANFMICFTVYVLGHLIPLISQATEGRFEIVRFVGRFSAAIFPNLEAFDTQTAIAGGIAVPGSYLAVSLVYTLLFSTVAMLLALILFEDRDLA